MLTIVDPHIRTKIVFHAGLFKVHCLQFKAAILSEDEVRNLLTLFGLKERHFRYSYKMFDGYFPTLKWMISRQANRNDMEGPKTSIHVRFSYSDGQRSIVSNGTLGMELSAWLEEPQRINAN